MKRKKFMMGIIFLLCGLTACGSKSYADGIYKAQKARAACDYYAEQLVEKGDLSDVDAISGATVNYQEFQEAVSEALKQAEQ